MKIVAVDERQELYQRAITNRELLPIRGNWAEAVRKDVRRKKQKERRSLNNRGFSFYA